MGGPRGAREVPSTRGALLRTGKDRLERRVIPREIADWARQRPQNSSQRAWPDPGLPFGVGSCWCRRDPRTASNSGVFALPKTVAGNRKARGNGRSASVRDHSPGEQEGGPPRPKRDAVGGLDCFRARLKPQRCFLDVYRPRGEFSCSLYESCRPVSSGFSSDPAGTVGRPLDANIPNGGDVCGKQSPAGNRKSCRGASRAR